MLNYLQCNGPETEHYPLIFYLDSPKSVTLTVPFASTKQFLAACGQNNTHDHVIIKYLHQHNDK